MDTKLEETLENTDKTSFLTKLGFTSAEMGAQMTFYMISSYLTIFYTDGVGLAPVVVSALMLVVRIIEAISAPIVGGIIDQTNSKLGKCRPWLIRGLPFLVVFSALTFFDTGANNLIKIIYACITYIGLVISFSFVSTATATMVNTLSGDSQERAVLNSWKTVGGNAIGILLAAITMPLILFFGNNAKAYSYTNLIYALIAIPLILFAFYTCKEKTTLTKGGPKVSVKESLLSASKNTQLLSLMLYNFITLTANFTRIGVMTYYYIYAVGRPEIMGSILMGYQIGRLLPPFFVPAMVKKFGKKTTFFIANIGQGASLLLLYFSGFENITLIFVGTFLLGFFLMNGLTTFNATSDCIEYEYYKTGKRTPGAIVGAITLSVKAGLALGGSIGVLLIGFAGYSSGVDITMGVRNNINLVVNVIPAILFFVGLIALIPYKLSNKKVAEIQAANEKKI